MVKWLCVAEKPSIAKSVAGILSGGQFTTVRPLPPPLLFPPVLTSIYSHSARLDTRNGSRTTTSRTGWGTVLAIPTSPSLQSQVTSPAATSSTNFGSGIAATLETFSTLRFERLSPKCVFLPFLFLLCNSRFILQDDDHRGIESNLQTEARRATHLMIWTDCDREGEYIGSVVAQVCQKVNRGLIVKRARFSAIIAKCVFSYSLLLPPVLTRPSQPNQPSLPKPRRP
jgi:DNA topoisomerase-3